MPTLSEALLGWAETRGDALALLHTDDTGREASRTYRALQSAVAAHAAKLREATTWQEPVLLVLPQGLPFIEGFLACLAAGRIAVPVRPPGSGKSRDGFAALAADAGARCVLCTPELEERSRSILPDRGASLRWMTLADPVSGSGPADPGRAAAREDDVAMLQYTSGSTGRPKGVVVTHRSLAGNLEFSRRLYGYGKDSRGCSWLPMYHDMGLIGMVLGTLHAGAATRLLSPQQFVRRPRAFLEAVGEHRADITALPNFALEHCVVSVPPESRVGLDLSTLRTLIVGAEPVRMSTLREFHEAFRDCGLRKDVFVPSYGMAEATLCVAAARLDLSTDRRAHLFDRESLRAGRAVPVGQDAPLAHPCVPHGKAAEGMTIRVVDPDTRRILGPGAVGEIWVSADHLAAGYWRDPETTDAVFHAAPAGGAGDTKRYLRTGDLGFLLEGELYVSGRRKDLIIVRGRNHQAHDIEATVRAAHAAVQPEGVVAYGVERAGTEAVALVVEFRRGHLRNGELRGVHEAVMEAVAREHEVSVASISFVRPHSLPRTSSGKSRRQLARTMVESGDLVVLPGPEVPRPPPPPVTGAASAELAAWIASWLERRLGGPASPETAPAALGIDSLVAAEMATALEHRLGRTIDPAIFFGRASIAALASEILEGPAAHPPLDPGGFTRDAELLSGIVVRGDRASRDPPRSILLTGATGFLGAFLLERLLEATDARIVCLVRAGAEDAGWARLESARERYGLPEVPSRERVSVICGDLTQPELGSPAHYRALVDGMDAVVHTAAHVDFTLDYPALRAATVVGTRHVIELAAAGRPKHLHHVSSLAVFESSRLAGAVVDEETSPVPSEGIALGYSQAKWVSEQLVLRARAAGLDVSVHRPSFLSGHSVTGAWSSTDFLLRLLQGCVALGAFPMLDYDLDASPVDTVARAVVASVAAPSRGGVVLHLGGEPAMPWEEVGHELRVAGFELDLLPYEAWRSRLAGSLAPGQPLYAFRRLFEVDGPDGGPSLPHRYRRAHRPRIRSARTAAHLARLGLAPGPAFQAALRATYIPTLRRQ